MRRKKKQKVPTLDLHGQTTDQVFSLIEDFLSKHRHQPKIKIITGKGTGAMQNKTKEYLQMGSYPWEYEKLPNGGTNIGVLIICLN